MCSGKASAGTLFYRRTQKMICNGHAFDFDLVNLVNIQAKSKGKERQGKKEERTSPNLLLKNPTEISHSSLKVVGEWEGEVP